MTDRWTECSAARAEQTAEATRRAVAWSADTVHGFARWARPNETDVEVEADFTAAGEPAVRCTIFEGA